MKLSLRDLFWATALVAMGCAWWVDRKGRRETNLSLQKQLSDSEELIRSLLFRLEEDGYIIYRKGDATSISPPRLNKP